MPAETDPPAWVSDAIAYQIFPDRFARSPRVHKPGPLGAWESTPTRDGFKGGDLLGIVEHLDHLAELGVNAISLNPVFASAANHRYHTYDYRQVDPLLGGDAALRELLDSAHGRGMRVVLDGVFNHASRGFWPFHHVLENGAASPYVDWFLLNPEWLASGRPLRAYPDPPAPETLEAGWALTHGAGRESLTTLGYRAWWDLPALPKLNTQNPEVREYVMQTAEHWIGFGADGWRLDVATEIEAPGFWQEFRRRVRAVNPEAYILAEVWDERPDLLDGSSFDGLMNYPLMVAIVGFAAGRHLDTEVIGKHSWLGRHLAALDGEQFAARLDRLMGSYPSAARGAMLNLVGGHDTPRLRTVARGDRAAVRLALLTQMTLPGLPCIYYGDEIGLEGAMDPGSRGAFPWDPGAWDGELLAGTGALIALRRDQPVLRQGGIRVLGASGPAVAYLRAFPDDADDGGQASAALIAMNNGEASHSIVVGGGAAAGTLPLGARWRGVPLPGMPVVQDPVTAADGSLTIDLPPRSGTVLLHPG